MDIQLLIDSLTKIVTDIITFIPRLVNGLIILVVGYLIAVAIRWLLRTILRRIRFDALIERTNLDESFRSIGVQATFSQLIAQLVFFFLLISFLITATRLMGLEAVAVLLERILGFFPQLVAAVIVFLIGGVVARFVSNLVTTAAQGAGLDYAGAVGRLIQGILFVFVIIIALGVLGIDTALLVTVLTILVAAFGLALGLALGLGGRPIVFQLLTGHYLRQRIAPGQQVTINDLQGEVSSISSTSTTLVSPTEEIVVPNTTLFESIIRLQTATPPPPPTNDTRSGR